MPVSVFFHFFCAQSQNPHSYIPSKTLLYFTRPSVTALHIWWYCHVCITTTRQYPVLLGVSYLILYRNALSSIVSQDSIGCLCQYRYMFPTCWIGNRMERLIRWCPSYTIPLLSYLILLDYYHMYPQMNQLSLYFWLRNSWMALTGLPLWRQIRHYLWAPDLCSFYSMCALCAQNEKSE